MNTDYAAYYSALELEPGASPAEVKKAYFRLVRQFTPEKDPEHFKLIRQAYEALKDGGPPPETSAFPEPEDSLLKEAIQWALQEIRRGNYEEASAIYQNALKLRPDEPYLLLRLAQAQKAAGHPQKAAKTASRLTELYPDCKEAHSLMALATYDRGWYKKALPMFRKAFELGERNVDFLTDYASAAMDNVEREETQQISREILKNDTWNKDNVESAIEAYCHLGHCVRTREDALSLLDSYGKFLTKYRRFPYDTPHLLTPLVGMYSVHPDFMEDFEVYRGADAVLQKIDAIAPEDKMTRLLRYRVATSAIHEEKRIRNEAWVGLAEMTFDAVLVGDSQKVDADMLRFGTLDAQLCLLKKPDEFSQDVSIVRENYPLLYESQRDFIERALSDDRDALWEELKRRFFKLEYKYDGSNFLERYPEERPMRLRGVRIHDGERPFVRDGKKIGRNAPCPCGSGKKFKRCCMGKGIYD